MLQAKPTSPLLSYWLPVTVLLLGALSGAGFWWLNHLGALQRQYDSLVDAVYEIDRQASSFHLWLKDHLAEESIGAADDRFRQQPTASARAADLLLSRMRNEMDVGMDRQAYSELLTEFQFVRDRLIELDSIAAELGEKRGSGLEEVALLDARSNAVFQRFSRHVRRVEELLKRSSLAHFAVSIVVFRIIFVGWLLLVTALAATLVWAEARRLRTARELADSEKRFRSISESAMDAIVLADGAGAVSYWNPAAERMFGRSAQEVVGRDLCRLILPGENGDSGMAACHALWRIPRGGASERPVEVRVRSGDGRIFPVEVSVAPVRLDGREQGIAIFRDVSERQEAEAALRENETLLRSLIDAMPDFVCFKDGAGRWLKANTFGLSLFGLQGVDYRGKTDMELAGTDAFFRPVFAACLESDEEAWRLGVVSRCDEMVPRPDGGLLVFDVIKVPLFNDDGSRKGLVVIGREITQRKKAEAALRESEERLRHLSSSLLVVQETERRRIAIELHDELGQSLAALKMQVRAVQRRFGEDVAALRQDCDDICDNIGQTIANVRRLSRDLSPVALEDLGLVAAIKHLVSTFAELYGMEVTLTVDDINHLLAADAERHVYRTLQEALTNIAKHAQADELAVSVSRRPGVIDFVIRDNGRGFDVEAVSHGSAMSKGLGLTAMAERVRMLGGSLDIASQAGQGTTIAISVPDTVDKPEAVPVKDLPFACRGRHG